MATPKRKAAAKKAAAAKPASAPAVENTGAANQPGAQTPDESAVAGSQEAADVINEQGFVGDKVDPLPNEAYSLETGPDAPDTVETNAAVLRARADAASDPDATVKVDEG